MKLIYQDELDAKLGSCGYSYDDIKNYSDVDIYRGYDDVELTGPYQAISLKGLIKAEKIDWSDSDDLVNISLTFNDGDHFIVPCKKAKVNTVLSTLKDKKRISAKGILKCF